LKVFDEKGKDSLIEEIGRTQIEVVLVSLIVDENAGLRERLGHA
jgi:hypothetical protein